MKIDDYETLKKWVAKHALNPKKALKILKEKRLTKKF
jgi:hypothetical protein